MVDLTNAKVGDWCVFRDGGAAPVVAVESTSVRCAGRFAVWKDTGYHNRSREDDNDVVALHKDQPMWADDRGWFRFANMAMREFGEITVCCDADGAYWFGCPDIPGWMIDIKDRDSIEANIDAVEAAYAAHLAEQAKPALEWDDLLFLSTAERDGGKYVVYDNGIFGPGDAFDAVLHTRSQRKYLAKQIPIDKAKAACEQHARQSAK